VLCGAGNNAGDGYVIARLAREAQLKVTVAALSDPAKLDGDAGRAWHDYQSQGAGTVAFDRSLLADAELVVDALLGTGLDRPLNGAYLDAVAALNDSDVPVVAVDIPTGLNGTSGQVMGAAVDASLTATYVGLKQGLFLGTGPDHVGRLRFNSLDIPAAVVQQVEPSMQIFAAEDLARLLPPRPATAHKGRFGHVLVLGGNHGLGGAARLAGEAALRSGAGLVTVACRPENVSAVMAYRPELMCRGIKSPHDLDGLLQRATVIALGPGLGGDDWARELLTAVLGSGQPKVLDADALNLLAEHPAHRDDWILTPHPGEAARLLGVDNAKVQSDRLAALIALNDRYGGTAVLKGCCTLIGASDTRPYLVTQGNPAMATAGMGDVLTGLTAGILAQCPDKMHQAAAAAVYVHAVAGDRAAGAAERGVIATDLFSQLKSCLNPDH
jgi:NAD(P)H-hydrate epimerase